MSIKLERRRKTKSPCSVCALHPERCICAQIPKLDFKTRVLLVIHSKELKRTTNTGRLAVEALTNSRLYVRGEVNRPLDLSADLEGSFESVVLYPGADAISLASFKADRPVQLIVPDGNWRQAAKVGVRQKELARLPRVMLPPPLRASARSLRREHFEGGRATLEAIAEALAILEGREAVEPLFHLYRAKLEATWAGRPPS